MSYMIGFLAFPFLVSFLIVHFAIAKPYEKRNGKKYNVGLKILWIALIMLGLLFFYFI